MRGKGLSKTIFSEMNLVSAINYGHESIYLKDSYSFSKLESGVISGTGVLVCYDGDLNNILSELGEEPLWYTLMDGVLYRFVLPCGVAALKLTDIIKYDDVVSNNLVNEFNNGLDLIHIRREFDKLADPNLFESTALYPEAYSALKTLFHGGVMNANPGVYSNVHSYDLVSAHASNIVNESYPLGRFEPINMSLEKLRYIRKMKGIFFLGFVTFVNLRLKPKFLGIIYAKPDAVVFSDELEIDSSGYLISAKKIRLPITETYLECIDICYEYDSVEDECMFYCSESGKLPSNIREYVLSKYNIKKSMPKNTSEYREAKLLVNLCYGFLCRTTDDYEHYAYKHKLVYPYQFGVYTCIYTTLKIVKAMAEVINNGGFPVAFATDSIKYVGDFELSGGSDLGELKYEATYRKACVVSVYKAVYEFADGSLDIKLAGCLKDRAIDYFTHESPADIFMKTIVIPRGRVIYQYNKENSKFEPVYMDCPLYGESKYGFSDIVD